MSHTAKAILFEFSRQNSQIFVFSRQKSLIINAHNFVEMRLFESFSNTVHRFHPTMHFLWFCSKSTNNQRLIFCDVNDDVLSETC